MWSCPALRHSNHKDEPAGAYLDSPKLGSWEAGLDAVRAGNLFEPFLLSAWIGYVDAGNIDGYAIPLEDTEYKITALRVREGAEVFEELSRTGVALLGQFALEIQRYALAYRILESRESRSI
jgi:hypothetical protein